MTAQKQNLENKLKEHKGNLSRLHLIECEMKRIESEIQVLEPSYISAFQYTFTPKSTTNKFHSIVENTVLENEKSKAEVDRLKAELWELAKERLYLQIKVEYVQALLEGLTAEEKFIIERYYFDGLQWYMVAEKYRQEYGEYKTAKTMKRKGYEALRKMERNLSKVKSPV